jgi:hypothetical protein
MKFLMKDSIGNEFLEVAIVMCFGIIAILIVLNEYSSWDLIQPSLASDCNCTMDYVADTGGNLTPVSMPRINIVKNETLESQTEGSITWTGAKSVPLMNIISDKFLIGNLSGGTSVTIALNTINTTSNGTLGVQITGGSVPDIAKAEIVKAVVNANGTLRQVESTEKIAEFPLLHDKVSKKSSSANNILRLDIPDAGYYLLVISIVYDPISENNLPDAKQLIGVYQSILRVE